MDNVEIRRLDFNLLLVFSELLIHRKATVVAERLGLTQSTISHALSRLRELFGDELFLRRSNGFEPTQRALAMEADVRAMLALAGKVLDPARGFDPGAEQGSVRIGASDYACAVLAPPLIRRLRESAPGLTLSVRPLVRRPALDALAHGDLDLALGFFWGQDATIRVEDLYEETYAVVARADHPAVRRNRMSLDAYCEADHALVSFEGDGRGIVDRSLEDLGRSRRVVATVPFAFPALALAASSDVIATVPRRLAQAYGQAFGLALLEPPLTIRPFTVSIAWHERTESSLLRAWVVSEIRSSLGAPET